jgi:hypothetical protein
MSRWRWLGPNTSISSMPFTTGNSRPQKVLLCAVVLLALALMHWSLSFSGRELDSQEAWQA